MTDEKYYEMMERQDKIREKALSKARTRGEVAKEWLKVNKLTKETQPEFNRLMRNATK